MDVIEEFERTQFLARVRRVIKLLAGIAGLYLLWWMYSTWQEDSVRTHALLRDIERQISLIKIPERPPTKTFSWIAVEPFSSGRDDVCGPGADIAIVDCDWKWRPIGQAAADPVALIRDSVRKGQNVVIISSVGHDDQALSVKTMRSFGTNFNLASRRSKALAKAIVVRAGASGCDEPDSNVHCVAVPEGAPAVTMPEEKRASARVPRLTVLVGG